MDWRSYIYNKNDLRQVDHLMPHTKWILNKSIWYGLTTQDNLCQHWWHIIALTGTLGLVWIRITPHRAAIQNNAKWQVHSTTTVSVNLIIQTINMIIEIIHKLMWKKQLVTINKWCIIYSHVFQKSPTQHNFWGSSTACWDHHIYIRTHTSVKLFLW